jgi:hypothetical protein
MSLLQIYYRLRIIRTISRLKWLSDRTIFTMTIFTKGNPEDYLQHVHGVLRLKGQKGLEEQCKKQQKEKKEHAAALGALKQKSRGPPKGCKRGLRQFQRRAGSDPIEVQPDSKAVQRSRSG